MTAGGAGALMIFGATGDLARLETFPALAGLAARGVLAARRGNRLLLPGGETWHDPAGQPRARNLSRLARASQA